MTPYLDLHGLALILDRSYDYTVRHWRRMCREEGLPEPYVGKNGRKPRWSRKAVEAWRDGEAPSPAPISSPKPKAMPSDGPGLPRSPGARALVRAAGGGVQALLKAAGG